MPGVASVGVEARVDDGDLKAERAAGMQEAAENLSGFFPGEAAGVPVVDSRHQIVVEDIEVHRAVARSGGPVPSSPGPHLGEAWLTPERTAVPGAQAARREFCHSSILRRACLRDRHENALLDDFFISVHVDHDPVERANTRHELTVSDQPEPRGHTCVSADQRRRCVVRDRIELSTFRFSGQPR